MMRTLIYSLFLALIIVSGVFAATPQWAILSTEVDENLDGSGYRQRHALELDAPNFTWPGSIFFDPGMVIGVDTGLDSFHYIRYEDSFTTIVGMDFFSTEVDFWYNDIHYEDEDLMMYDEMTDTLSQVWDVKDILGADYGLDAVAFLGFHAPRDSYSDYVKGTGYWAFSTEVDGTGFGNGDILITDGVSLKGVIPMTYLFGQDVGLDGLHYLGEGWNGSWADTSWAFSTEVDGSFDFGDENPAPDGAFAFNDEDVIILEFIGTEIGGVEVAWTGVDGFGRDVGLDAIYIAPGEIPEPASLVLASLGFAMFIRRFRKK